MKRFAMMIAACCLVASTASATYIVVLKSGDRYRAKEKWTIVNGKAMLPLENGTTIALDPNLIDVKTTNQVNASGLGDVKVLETGQGGQPAPKQQQPSLGSFTKLRPMPRTTQPGGQKGQPPVSSNAPAPVGSPGAGNLGSEVLSKFAEAYDNVGIFDAKVSSPAPNTVRVELTADTEDQVFKAISATSYMMVKVPESTGTQIVMTELFMKQLNGGAAGRFQMSREDASAIVQKRLSWQTYYIQKVIF